LTTICTWDQRRTPSSEMVRSRSLSLGDRQFESVSLHRRVGCEPELNPGECRVSRPYRRLHPCNADEFIRRFVIHVLPDGFHRIRHYGLFANANRAGNIALARRFLGVPDPAPSSGGASDGTENCHEDAEWNACPCCGGRMIIIETFEPGCQPRLWPIPSIGLDSS
jgi:hypothetical protein